MKRAGEIDKRSLSAIAQIKTNSKGYEIKLFNKLRALELLGKYYFGGTAGREVTGDAEDMSGAFGEVFGDEQDY